MGKEGMRGAGPAKKVLIVDPSEESRRSIGRFLRDKGFETFEVPDGRLALSETLLKLPDIMLLDMSAGVLTPERLVSILRANPNTNSMPVLFMSDKAEGVAGFRQGIDGFLRKPAREEEIYSMIRRSLFPDSVPAERGFPRPEGSEEFNSRKELIFKDKPEGLNLLFDEEGIPSENGRYGRMMLFLPDPSSFDEFIAAFSVFKEFEADGNFLSLRREGAIPVGMFGKIRVGDAGSLMLYSFPYLRSASPLWHAMAPRPLGVVAYMKGDVSRSLDGLIAVSKYARGVNARAIMAVMGDLSADDFGMGDNTLLLFRTRIERMGFSLKILESGRLSPKDIRDSILQVVGQNTDGGKR